MDLVLKIPKNKPPFIGVLFNYENDAVMFNESWTENAQIFSYTLVLEPAQKLYITMLSDNHFSNKYEVTYNPVTLIEFLHNTRDKTEFSFGHLRINGGALVIPKTRKQNRPLLFKIDNIKVPMLTMEA